MLFPSLSGMLFPVFCASEIKNFLLSVWFCPAGIATCALVSNLVNKGGLSSRDVAAQYKHKNAVVDVKLDTESNVVANLIF
ncbi:hypothetical protein REPUB_Repub19eG0056900 [Reevesia pubescens]